MTSIEVCIISHNEERSISACLDSIALAIQITGRQDVRVHIINNGSADRTQLIAQGVCALRDNWSCLAIELGDKANAWNAAIYQCIEDDYSLVIFVDADCRVNPMAILAFQNVLRRRPDAYVLAGCPEVQGNTSLDIIQRTIAGLGLSGNLYAVTPRFLRAIKKKNFRLPVGLIGDDSLLAWVSSHDFSLRNGIRQGLLVGVPTAIYHYERLVPNSWRKLRLYIRRLRRYSLRHLQQKCIRVFLDEHDDFSSLPREIEALYRYHRFSHVRKDGLLNFLFDYLAHRRIRKFLDGLPNTRL